MSAFWSDACNNALSRPLHVLLDTVHAFCGILVRRVCFVSPVHLAACRCAPRVALLLLQLPRDLPSVTSLQIVT